MIIFFIGIIGIGVMLLLFMVKQAFENNIVNNTLYFADFPESFGEVKIFFISDIHRRSISNSLLQKVEVKPDLVVIGGDLTEKGVPMDRVMKNISLLKQLGPVYFVWGNNDYEVDYHELDAMLLESGVKILDNTAARFESSSGDALMLMGIDDLVKGRPHLDFALQDAQGIGFKILVSHNPKISESIKPSHQIRLVLSGHTHGGQIRFFGFGPYKKGGIERTESHTLLVSNGFGTTGVPLRLGAKPEAHFIRIRKQSPNKKD